MKQIVTLFMGILFALEAFSAVEIPIRTARSLRHQVDTYAELLNKEVSKVKTLKEKFKTIGRVKTQIKELRKGSAPQGAHDEAYMDLMLAALDSLPAQKGFKKKNCLKYESELLVEFEPVAEEKPQDPALQPAWNVLQSLCN